MPRTIAYNWPGWCLYLYTQWFANKKIGHETTHEEVDIITNNKCKKQLMMAKEHAKLICDDADMFILLLYYYQMNWQNDILLAF